MNFAVLYVLFTLLMRLDVLKDLLHPQRSNVIYCRVLLARTSLMTGSRQAPELGQ